MLIHSVWKTVEKKVKMWKKNLEFFGFYILSKSSQIWTKIHTLYFV